LEERSAVIVRTARWDTTERYYELYEGEDLFGQNVLVQVWGGKGSRRGRSRTVVPGAATIAQLKHAIGVRRRRHGYVEQAVGQERSPSTVPVE
jgi:predicted DNA-binding WGR domain protein